MNNKFWLFALGLGCGCAPALFGSAATDTAALLRLNEDYLQAFLTCDVGRYRQLLADDFSGVLADGRIIDKAEFLRQAAQPPHVTGWRREEPTLRLYGDTALVCDLIAYQRTDGTTVQTRYVDVYRRRQGQWQIVSAQFTRVASP